MYRKELGNIREVSTQCLLVARQWLKSWLFVSRYGSCFDIRTNKWKSIQTDDDRKMEAQFKRIDEELLRRRSEGEEIKWKPTVQE